MVDLPVGMNFPTVSGKSFKLPVGSSHHQPVLVDFPIQILHIFYENKQVSDVPRIACARGCQATRPAYGGINMSISLTKLPMTDPDGAAIYGVPWIPSTKTPFMLAYIYIPAPWIRHGLKIQSTNATKSSLSWVIIFL